MTDCPLEGRQQGPPDGAAALAPEMVLYTVYLAARRERARNAESECSLIPHSIKVLDRKTRC